MHEKNGIGTLFVTFSRREFYELFNGIFKYTIRSMFQETRLAINEKKLRFFVGREERKIKTAKIEIFTVSIIHYSIESNRSEKEFFVFYSVY